MSGPKASPRTKTVKGKRASSSDMPNSDWTWSRPGVQTEEEKELDCTEIPVLVRRLGNLP